MTFVTSMYKKPYFLEEDHSIIMSFIQAHPFITLIGTKGDCPCATQVPVLVEQDDSGQVKLYGHIIKGSDHHRAFQTNNQALALFTGAHCYVSSGWYTTPTGATWNYQTVHTRGTIRLLEAEDTIDIIRKLTAYFEAGQERPLLIDGIPAAEVQAAPKAIAGFELVVTDIHAVFKLSQNRDDESYRNIVTQLRKTTDKDAHIIADEMVIRRKELFHQPSDIK